MAAPLPLPLPLPTAGALGEHDGSGIITQATAHQYYQALAHLNDTVTAEVGVAALPTTVDTIALLGPPRARLHLPIDPIFVASFSATFGDDNDEVRSRFLLESEAAAAPPAGPGPADSFHVDCIVRPEFHPSFSASPHTHTSAANTQYRNQKHHSSHY